MNNSFLLYWFKNRELEITRGLPQNSKPLVNMNFSRFRLKLWLFSSLLLLFALGFNATLSLSSFQKSYWEIFQSPQLTTDFNNLLRYSSIAIGIIALLGIIYLFLAVRSVFHVSSQKKVPQAAVYLALLGVIATAQLLYSIWGFYFYQDSYVSSLKDKAHTIGTHLQTELESALTQEPSLWKQTHLEGFLHEHLEQLEQLSSIQVRDTTQSLVYQAEAPDPPPSILKIEWLLSYISVPLSDTLVFPLYAQQEWQGTLHLYLSAPLIWEHAEELMLDSLTVLVITILFVVEFIIFFMIYMKTRLAKAYPNDATQDADAYGAIRPAAFIYLMAISFSVSFLPLHLENLYEPIFGLSKNIIMGLPISVTMFCTMLSFIVGGIWMDKRGWHEPFLFGVALSAFGSFLSGIATDAVLFIACRGVVGLGYGLGLMASQGFIFANTDFATRAKGISHLVAGFYAGNICGEVLGAMLAERIGYGAVFFVAMGLMCIPILFVVLFMKESFTKPRLADTSAKTKLGWRQISRFITNRNMFALLLFSSMPGAFCTVGFLYYISPIYLNRIGISQANIGRSLMIYSLCMIFLAPLISRLVSRSDNKKLYIALGGISGALGLVLFYIQSGVSATMFAILMLGMAGSFGFASQTVFALDLKVTQELGEGQAMGIYRAVERLGQVIGPIAMGAIITIRGIEEGITIIGGIYLGVTLLFILVSRNEATLSVDFRRRWNPAHNTPEKNYAYASVAAMALIAAADGILEESEVQEAKKWIDSTEEIRQYLSSEEAQQVFHLFINELLECMEEEGSRFDIAVNLLLQKIPYVATDEWKMNIIALATRMAIADGSLHETEEAMIHKIGSALWKSYDSYYSTQLA